MEADLRVKRNIKGLFLFSGGLDSILAVKILQQQKIKVIGVAFVTYFWRGNIAQKSAQNIHLPLVKVYLGQEYLKIIRQSKFGYGSGINPCLDCRILMLKKAKNIFQKKKFDFIATGEVLGERPMTQNRQAMKLIERESGLSGYLLRPLSAKLLPPTILEEKGLINREKLLSIQGRSRKPQIGLAQKLGIAYYPSPAGGCILCEKEYARKLRNLLNKKEKVNSKDIKLLRIGQHFWLNQDQTEVIVGRNYRENQRLGQLAKINEKLIEPDYPAPSVLIRGKINQSAIKFAWDKINENKKNSKTN